LFGLVELHLSHVDAGGKRAEAVAKLITQMRAGPLKHLRKDEFFEKGAADFLKADKGRTWCDLLTVGSKRLVSTICVKHRKWHA